MRRVALLLLFVALSGLLVLLPPRSELTIPTVPSSLVEAPAAASSVGYCGWVHTESALEMSIGFAGQANTQALVTVAQGGAVVADEQRALAPFGSVGFKTLLAAGSEGAIVEFDIGPAAAAAVGEGLLGLVAVDCPTFAADVWVLGGGSTVDGSVLELSLFNPFPEDAKLSIRAISENGSEPVQSLEAMSVPGQSSRTILLSDMLAFREWLSVEIEQIDGRVIPTFVERSDGGGVAAQSGVAVAETWYFPFSGVEELANTLVLVNPSAAQIGYQIDTATVAGGGDELDRDILDIRQVSTVRLDVPGGLVVRADAPMAAFLMGRGETGQAAVPGSPVMADEWLLPGAGALSGTTVVVLNPGTTDVTATLISRTGQEKLFVPAGGLASAELARSAGGAQVLSTGPVVVGWYSSGPTGVAYALGVPVVTE